jgi:hypothetical protein
MGAALDDAPVVQYENFVRVHDRRKPVCNNESGMSVRDAIELCLDRFFRLRIER